MAERIMSSGSSSSSSLQEEVDEKQSTASGGDSNGKDSANKVKDGAAAKKDKKSKSSTKKDRRDTSRLFGDGVNFKAKLIGFRDVPQARGEKMAQETLQELKSLKKSSGEHKQKIVINISLEGLKIREEKTKELLFLQPVHKISFISQDASDNRAFGYIYGSPDNVHTFYAIKTEKAAQQIVMCMRDLFQVAYERKKKEIEQWRMQQASQPTTGHSPSTSLGSQSTDGSFQSENSEKGRDLSSPSSLNSCNSGYSRGVGSHNDGSVDESQHAQSRDPTSLLLDLSIEEPKRSLRNPFEDTPNGDPFFTDPWAYVRSMSEDGSDMTPIHVAVGQNDPFMVAPELHYLSAMPHVEDYSNAVHGGSHLATSLNDPFNTSFVNGSLAKPCNEFSSSFTSTPVTIQLATHETEDSVPVPTLSVPGKQFTTLSEISCITMASARGEGTSEGSGSVASSFYAGSALEAGLLNEGFLGNKTEDASNVSDYLLAAAGSDLGGCHLGSYGQPSQQVVPTFVFSDLDPLGKDRPYVDKKDFFQDVKNPPKKVLKDLMAAENGFPTSDFGFASEPSDANFQVSNFADAFSTLPPPSAPPPPLPPPLYRRSLTSPTSSLEDASMGGGSASSSAGSTTSSSPVYDVLLPPPPPPPPRPSQQVSMPKFLPPPPPLPPKHSRALPLDFGTGSPTSDIQSPVACPPAVTGVLLCSPPIPIPSRRSPRGAFTPTMSTSGSSPTSLSSSASNQSSGMGFGGSSSDGSLSSPGPVTPVVADANNNPSSGGFEQQKRQSALARSTSEVQQWNNLNEANVVGNLNQSNISNPFVGDIFISPPPQHTGMTRRQNGPLGGIKKGTTLGGIFQKEENPFADDDFFAALKPDMATTPNGNAPGAIWNGQFEDNFAQNR